MKNVVIVLIILMGLTGCVSSKIEKEFEAKKPALVLVMDVSETVEKKKAITILFEKYINTAPADTVLLPLFNQYLMYSLFNLGYTSIAVKDKDFDPSALSGVKLVYTLNARNLVFKEYKIRENVSDGTNSKTVKLRGLELSTAVQIKAGLRDTISTTDDVIARAEANKEESQEGQFEKNYGVIDLIKENKDGSIKYLYKVQKMDDGVFQNLCIKVATDLAKQIDYKIKLLYQREVKGKR